MILCCYYYCFSVGVYRIETRVVIKPLANIVPNAIMDVTKLRGGDAEAGSCLWADLDEHNNHSDYFHGIYQVFGHTQQKKKAVIKKYFADLDCRKAFLITSKGKIREIKE